MRISLFERVPYERLGERHAAFEVSTLVAKCERLREIGLGDDEFSLEGEAEPHAQGVRLHGRVSGEISVQCCRCLGSVSLAIDRPFDLVVVGSESAMAALPDSVDAHHAPELMGRLVDILEEEVLLAIPDFPAHGDGECEAPAGADVDATVETPSQDEQKTQRPFAAALRGIARKPDN